MTTKFVLAIALAAGMTGCNQKPEAGQALEDGCYFLGETPVLRISGDLGQVLVDSDVQEILVETEESDLMHRAIFSPGINLTTGKKASVRSNPKFPRSFYMMAPDSDVPTILMPRQDSSIARLVHRPSC